MIKRNDIIFGELGFLIENFQHSKLVTLGDFNGIIGPQPINKNGRRLTNIADKYYLFILNLDQNCEGKVIREQGNWNDTIDFVLFYYC